MTENTLLAISKSASRHSLSLDEIRELFGYAYCIAGKVKISKALNAYRFDVGGFEKYIYAKNIEDALGKVTKDCMSSFLKGEVYYLSSTDNDAPRERCLVRYVDIFTLSLKVVNGKQ